MGEILAGLLRVVMEAITHLNPVGFVQKRRRARRLQKLTRGESVGIPVDLRDPELTDGAWENGHILLGSEAPLWQPSRPDRTAAHFFCPELRMTSADEATMAFRSESGRTELRVHSDEAPAVLRALQRD
ncbi:hypothetical protein LIX60_05010 [Streptomyces sp. S07_1.15]|uniref:hypothetical protein n=1 Tax=Streptomyces sp. S07_1.15 TaxID=2873925 RepID=UPI001D13AC6A|nr:hypothetical protein [Streptomyces sp. S07_1.15]MCC3650846.1 hypothetical protein [Streptomyces sp. S07_1.15]